ncbi:hypothetical protein EVAR_42100_1 [Eumeta japonica]|uniref:Uncharacterized protein n=1 Tax=Eumeta variegata TaxID=151549 RepID=A0A4C1XEP3_EUMVA|nr:hypothetical protein EVAR_42100_1 [Eumeta japonica]
MQIEQCGCGDERVTCSLALTSASGNCRGSAMPPAKENSRATRFSTLQAYMTTESQLAGPAGRLASSLRDADAGHDVACQRSDMTSGLRRSLFVFKAENHHDISSSDRLAR